MKRTKLPRSPLVLVVAQVRFSTVEDIQKYVPTVKEELKVSGFPCPDQSTIQQITVMGGQGFQVSHADQWHFADKKKHNNIILTKNSISVNTVNYDTFDVFLPNVLTAVTKVSPILNLPEYAALERISLRYVDWIYELDGVAPERMIKPEYTGGFLDAGEDVLLRQMITDRKTSVGTVRSIIFKPNDINAVMGEFQSVRLNQPKFTQGNHFLILDIEHTKTVPNEDFAIDYIESSFQSLHDEMDTLFFEIMPTKEALDIWGKEEK